MCDFYGLFDIHQFWTSPGCAVKVTFQHMGPLWDKLVNHCFMACILYICIDQHFSVGYHQRYCFIFLWIRWISTLVWIGMFRVVNSWSFFKCILSLTLSYFKCYIKFGQVTNVTRFIVLISELFKSNRAAKKFVKRNSL